MLDIATAPHHTIEGTLVRVEHETMPRIPEQREQEELPDTPTIFSEWRQEAPRNPEAAFSRMLTLLGDRANTLAYNISLDLAELGRMIAYGDQIGIHYGSVDPHTGEYVGKLKGSFNTTCNNMFEWLVREVRVPKTLVRLAISTYQVALRLEEFSVPLELLSSLSEGHIRRIIADDRDVERQINTIERAKLSDMAHERGVQTLTKEKLDEEERALFDQEVGRDYVEQVRASILHIASQRESDVIESGHTKGEVKKPFLGLRGKYNPRTRQLMGVGTWVMDLGENELDGLEKNLLVLKFQIEGMPEMELQAGLGRFIRANCPPEPDDDDED